MSLRAYTRLDSGVAVVELDGRIMLGDGARVLRETVEQVLDAGHKNVLLDLEGVDYIDSAGLGELVGCNKLARSRGANMKLVHLQKKIKGLLQITKQSRSSKLSRTKMRRSSRSALRTRHKPSCASANILSVLPR